MSTRPKRADQVPPIPSARVFVPPDGLSRVVFLGPWKGFWIHWCGKRSFPCLDDSCPASRHVKPAHWYGYAPVAVAVYAEQGDPVQIGWKLGVLALSREQANEVGPKFKTFPGPGAIIVRPVHSKTWKFKTTWKWPSMPDLPATFDVEPTLYRVWCMMPEDMADDQAGELMDEAPTFQRNGKAHIPHPQN